MSDDSETTEPKGWSGYQYFSLDDIAAMQPGLARLMPEIGQRYWKAYYAAQAANWILADFQLKEIREVMEFGAITRPKYEQHLQEFIQRDLGTMLRAVQAKDWEAFETAFHEGVKNANDYHQANDKGYIVWKLPDHPPPDLDMTPQEP